MHVTAVNECYALDAGSGRQIWHFQRPRTPGTATWANRGVAVAGDRVFLATDDAHMLALNRWTGAILWEKTLANWRDNYFASSAPLTTSDLVITGVAGGEHGANGFIAALDQETGHEVWRFWTVPRPGEPGFDTWKGNGPPDHGGAPTWFTGSYDPDLDLVYWPTGNPSKEYNGDHRKGDNLYSDCILALTRANGHLRWYLPVHAARSMGLGRDADLGNLSTRPGRGARASSCCTPTATASSTFSIAPTASCRCSPNRSSRTLTWASSGIGADNRQTDPAAGNQEPRPPPARRSARRRTAPPTGSPRPSTRRRGFTTSRRSRSAAFIRRAMAASGRRAKPYLGGSQKNRASIPCRRSAC